MFKLEVEVASIYYFIDGILSPITSYFKEVPENMLTPSVFYPIPRREPSSWSTNAFHLRFMMYADFFDNKTEDAYMNAKAVQDAILANRRKIPIRDETGAKTTGFFCVDFPSIYRADTGIWELALSWDRYTKYSDAVPTLAEQFFMNGNSLGE